MKLTLAQAAAATGARVVNEACAPATFRVVTDTRALEAGDCFVALRGERFDGHAFIAQAAGKGAACVVVDDDGAIPDGLCALVVADTLCAYMKLAGASRDSFRGTVIGITGSAGKTTTKVFLRQLLATKFGDRVIASPANENNEIGVSKLLLESDSERHDAMVVEMGARHFNDIAALVEIARPQIGVLTNVGDAHLEIMGSRERLEETKWGLFSGGARAVLNAGDTATIARAPSLPHRAHWFCATAAGAEFPVHGRMTVVDGTRRVIDIHGDREDVYAIDARIPGAHNRFNVAAALSGALEAGVTLDAMIDTIPFLELPSGRYERIASANGVVIIFDAYNANAAGMIAALDAFASEAAARKIAVLSSMAELGSEASMLHRRVGRFAANGDFDALLLGGEFVDDLEYGAREAGMPEERIVRYGSNREAARWLREHGRSGDVVLLKGSRRYKLEEIVEELRA